MYKENLALNNLQSLICQKKPTKANIKYLISVLTGCRIKSPTMVWSVLTGCRIKTPTMVWYVIKPK